MPDNERLLDYYERELDYLRTAGEAFAREYPKVARRLELSGDESPDPHVERLLEGFAFLAARIHQNIDESTSAVAANLLEQLYPHALRPVPSATIVHFDTARAKVALDAGYRVERGAQLFTHTSAGEAVYFRTSYPVELWPISIAAASFADAGGHDLTGGARRDAASVLTLALRFPRSFASSLSRPGRLRFYVKGGEEGAPGLCDLLLGHTLEVNWHDGVKLRALGALPRYVGLEADEALLPERADTHSAYRLLLEYFAFPAKFHFFDLDCSALDFSANPNELEQGEAGPDLERELRFVLRRKPKNGATLRADVIQLGCTPVVNLFRRTAEPLRITHRQAQYKLVADHHRLRSTEIYSIERVTCPGLAPGATDEVAPYFYSHGSMGESTRRGPFWSARRVPTMTAGAAGSDMQLTFVDPDFAPADQMAPRTLSASVTCTNRHLAHELDPRAELTMEDADVTPIRLLHKPSAQIQPSLDGAARWQLVSQLSLNQWSLGDGAFPLENLRQLLALNNLTGELVADSQIRGLVSATCSRVTRFMGAGDDPWHGYRQGYKVEIRLDDKQFRDGSRMLFCAVLHRFLALYAGVNTFVELVCEGDGGQRHVWAPLFSKHVSL